jgi:hypothetical protein
MMEMKIDPLNKICKWRSVFTGWLFGTRLMDDPGSKAARDLYDRLIVLRVESSAIAALLVKKGVFTAEEFTTSVYHEAELLDAAYEKAFPGFKSTPYGMQINIQVAAETMKAYHFPE